MLLAIDDVSLPFRKNVCLYLTKPTVRPEPVLTPSPFDSNAPDNSSAHFYGTVLQDAGRFRMWYYAAHWGKNPDWPPRLMQQLVKPPTWHKGHCELWPGPLCYAESDDGIHWTKPALGQVLFKGSRANNAVAIPHAMVGAIDVIREPEDPDPARRYKMVYQYFPEQSDPIDDEYGWRPTVALCTSPDGLSWTLNSIPFKNQFVEQCAFLKYQGQYIIHSHMMDTWSGWLAEGGTACGRVGVARVSYDWDQWPDCMAETFALAEPEDPKLRGMNGDYDQVHIGVGAASFGNVCIGIYGLWHNASNTEGFDQISGDLGLLISNDGLHFREPVKGHRFIRRQESPATPVPGYDFHTVLCQGNGILNVGDQTRIYHGRWRNVGAYKMDEDVLRYYYGEVALATLPRDRWGALGLNPDAKEGVVWSAPLSLPAGRQITLNADGTDEIQVELAAERFALLPAFSGKNAGRPARPGGLDCAVTWPHSLAALAGQTVRLGVRLVKGNHPEPRLYAINLQP